MRGGYVEISKRLSLPLGSTLDRYLELLCFAYSLMLQIFMRENMHQNVFCECDISLLLLYA
jgi:hypothetical protein